MKNKSKRSSGISTMLTIFTIFSLFGMLLMGLVFVKKIFRINELNDSIKGYDTSITKVNNDISELEEKKASLEQSIKEQEINERTKYVTAGMDSLGEELKAIITEWPEEWSVYVKKLDESGEYLLFNNEQMRAGNLMGLYSIDAGYEAIYSQKITEMNTENLVEILSGNEDVTNELLISMGAGDISAGKKILEEYFVAHDMDMTGFGSDYAGNVTSAKDLGIFMENLYRNRSVEGRGVSSILDALAQKTKSQMLLLGIPDGAEVVNQTARQTYWAEDECKYDSVSEGAYVINGATAYVVSVMVNLDNQGNDAIPEDIKEKIGVISEKIYVYMMPEQPLENQGNPEESANSDGYEGSVNEEEAENFDDAGYGDGM